MKLESFKKGSPAAIVPPRTPSPISHFIEPLTPTYPTAFRDGPLFPNRNAEIHPARTASGQNFNHNGLRDETALDLERNGRPGRTSRRSRHHPSSGVQIPVHGSPIDALADIASSLAPSPLFAPPVHYPSHIQGSGQTVPHTAGNGQRHARLASDSQNYRYSQAYNKGYDYGDRPSKRARSEATHTLPYNRGSSRPSTSHIPSLERREQGEQSSSASSWAPQERGLTEVKPVDHDQMAIAEVLLGLRNGSIDGAQNQKTFSVGFQHQTGDSDQQAWLAASTTQTQVGFEHGKHDHWVADGHRQSHQPVKPSYYDSQGAGKRSEANSAHPSKDTSSALQTHTPPEERLETGKALASAEDPGQNDQRKIKSHQGWPKGKSRGPRNKNTNSKKAVKPTSVANGTLAAENAGDGLDGPGQLQSPQSLSAEPAEGPSQKEKGAEPISEKRVPELDSIRPRVELSSRKRRRSASDVDIRSRSNPENSRQTTRCCSVPFDNATSTTHPITFLSSVQQQQKQQPLTSTQSEDPTICAGCGFSRGPSTGQKDQWICCNGCQNWYHFACADFKSVKEVSRVDKFHCRPCRPKYGPTTFLRKSKRAHTAVDYAGLNEGVLRTAEDEHEHHYIQAIKEGRFKFQPETFARMRPELVTAENFEMSGGFKEPVVIPACWNPRPHQSASQKTPSEPSAMEHEGSPAEAQDEMDFETVPDDGQDTLDMVIPDGLTVRRVSELYGPEERVEVIDVKSQEGEDKRWTMNKWADYYEEEGDKPVRNVISLEVSQSILGRLIRRPKIVRDLDLQDSVWPQDEIAKGIFPKVQFYCLMSVADCYTDFHIDFGGSSVFYHIIKGKKTFFFIPPKKQHLKKYEDWCLSQAQNWTFLADETKECYRVDLSEGDTMLIPSGWIHAVWTPENSLVIGGNFLTRLNYGMQIRIAEIEKNTKVARKFRYPYFQRVLWLAVLDYLKTDPLPNAVAQMLCSGTQFRRSVPIYCELDKFGHNSNSGQENYNARYYSKSELDGMPDLVSYIFRTVLISQGRVEGVTNESRNAVTRSIPKGHGDPVDIVRTFAMWVAWKRGNEDIPQWAHPDGDLPELSGAGGEKKLSNAAVKRLERKALEGHRLAPERQSARQRTKAQDADIHEEDAPTAMSPPQDPSQPKLLQHMSTPKTSVLGPKRVACDACRKRRIRCKHKDDITSPKSGGTVNSDARRPSDAGMVAVVIPSPRKVVNGLPIIGAPVNGIHQPKLEPSTAITGPTIPLDPQYETPDAKRGRSKACLDCRKSKRRCIHDEYGNIDPVKALETPVPRGVKRSSNGGAEDGETSGSVKKAKKEPRSSLSLFNGATLPDHDVLPNGHIDSQQDTIPQSQLEMPSGSSVMEVDDADANLDPLLRGPGPVALTPRPEMDQDHVMEDAPDIPATGTTEGDAAGLAVREPERPTHEDIHPHSDVAIPSTEMDIDPLLDPALLDCVPSAPAPAPVPAPIADHPTMNGNQKTPAAHSAADPSSPLSELASSPQQHKKAAKATTPSAAPKTPTITQQQNQQRHSSRASKPVDRYSTSAHDQQKQHQRNSHTPLTTPSAKPIVTSKPSKISISPSSPRRDELSSLLSSRRRDSKTPGSSSSTRIAEPSSASSNKTRGLLSLDPVVEEDEASARMARELLGQDRGLRRRGF